MFIAYPGACAFSDGACCFSVRVDLATYSLGTRCALLILTERVCFPALLALDATLCSPIPAGAFATSAASFTAAAVHLDS